MRRIMLVFVLSYFVQIGTVHADEPIDKETIAAYEKLGGVYGGFRTEKYANIEFSQGEEAALKGLPGFWFKGLHQEGLPKLPVVKVPFGIGLSVTILKDRDLKEFADVKQLIALDLGGALVTDAGVKELAKLEQLNLLNLVPQLSSSQAWGVHFG